MPFELGDQVSPEGRADEIGRIISGPEGLAGQDWYTGPESRTENVRSNVIPVETRLPRDRPRLRAELDALLVSGKLDQNSPGSLPIWL
jgi:hypothetical protein